MMNNQQQHTPEERRYDAEAMQKVVALATRLQTEHQESFNAAQIESLGQELNIDPAFVRRALEMLDEGALTARSAPHSHQTHRQRPRRTITPLTARQIRHACTPALIYAIYAGLASSASHPTAELLVFIQPALLAPWLGARAAGKRLGMLAGIALGTLPIIASGMSRPFDIPLASAIPMALFLAAVGGSSAGVRSWWDNRKKQNEATPSPRWEQSA